MDSSLNIVDLIENNSILHLSPEYNNRFINKIKDIFTETQQQLFVSSFYCYLHYNQTTDFIIDLDNVWKWLGFNAKQKAKLLLEKYFIIDKDYKILLTPMDKQKTDTRGGHNKQTYLLNIRTFKLFCIKAGTEKATEIHEYFVKLEDIMNEIVKAECTELKIQLENQKLSNQCEKDSLREKTLIDQFPDNTQCVYYGKIDNVSSKNEQLIKFGCSNFLSNRIDRHKKTFSNFRLINVFKVVNKSQIENAMKHHKVLSSFRRTIEINNVSHNEVLSVQQLSFEDLDKIIKDIITDTEYNPEKYKILLKEYESIKRMNHLLSKELEHVKKITTISVEEFNMIKSQNLLLTEENDKLKSENEKLLKKYITSDKCRDNHIDLKQHTPLQIFNSLKRISKSSDGLYYINNKIYKNCFGSREEVWNETAYKTAGGLNKSDLMINKNGKIISKKKFITEKENNRLEKVNNIKKENAIQKRLETSSTEKTYEHPLRGAV